LKSDVEETILEQIEQRTMIQALGEPPNRQQIESVIHKMKNNKAPGDTGVTTDIIKNLPEEGYDLLTKVIQDFWTNPGCNFNSWHVQKLELENGTQQLQDHLAKFGLQMHA